MKRRQGFTLAELLIVVAIIAVLVAVAIPVFGGQVEKSKQAVDMANMRAAYAVLLADYLSGDAEAGKTYYFDINSSSIVTSKPSNGYGKSRTEIEGWSLENTTVKGIPNPNGDSPAVLSLMIGANDSVAFQWGGGITQVTNASEYQQLRGSGQAVASDQALLDSLESAVKSMTYGELLQILKDNGIKLSEGQGRVFLIAQSAVEHSTGNISQSTGRLNGVYAKELFESAGFDTSLSNDATYILSSMDFDHTVNMYLYLPGNLQFHTVKEDNPLLDQQISEAYVYLQGNNGVKSDQLNGMDRNSRTQSN